MARQTRHRLLVALALVAVAAAGCGASKDEGISGGGKVIGRTVQSHEALFGFKARTTFEEGLARTIDWYRLHRS